MGYVAVLFTVEALRLSQISSENIAKCTCYLRNTYSTQIFLNRTGQNHHNLSHNLLVLYLYPYIMLKLHLNLPFINFQMTFR